MHPTQGERQIKMDTENGISGEEWYDDTYVIIVRKVVRLRPDIWEECSEISQNLSNETGHYKVFAAREFAREHFQEYCRTRTVIIDEEEMDELVLSSTHDEFIHENRMVNDLNPKDTVEIPDEVTITTEHGTETFTKEEVQVMIRMSSIQA